MSVIIPAYNVENYISTCLESIINQTYNNFEILIYNDGSNDSTDAVIKNLKDDRITIYSGTENKGVIYARNFLLNRANGDFIVLQDADDWSHPKRIEKQLNFLIDNPDYKSCGTQFNKSYKNKTIKKSSLPNDYKVVYDAIPNEYHFLPATLAFRKEILNNIGLYNPFFGNDGNEDLYWISKIILSYPFKNLNEHLYNYELNLNSLTKFQIINSRKYYIQHITKELLKEYQRTGSNILEESNEPQLDLLEKGIKSKYGQLAVLEIYDRQIGQLLYFNQYILALKVVFLNNIDGISFNFRLKTALYILKKWLWK